MSVEGEELSGGGGGAEREVCECGGGATEGGCDTRWCGGKEGRAVAASECKEFDREYVVVVVVVVCVCVWGGGGGGGG